MPDPQRVGRLDLADIVREHCAALESRYRLSRQQKRVLTDVANCRTAALGGHLDRCTVCGYERPSYNSCRNRHCPKCQALAQEKWIEKQGARMLDAPHFHVVFTLPAELRALAAFAPVTIYSALFRVAAATLAAFARRRLSAQLGMTLVLHTWTRKLEFHPHVHAIVTAGGLSLDGDRWCSTRREFLFPVKLMATVFRGKIIAALRRMDRKGEFKRVDDFRDPEGFGRLIRTIAKVPWYVYAKPTFSRGLYVMQYLGRYTHRVGIANSRLLAISPNAVTFRTKGSATETLHPVEFLRRFVRHVLPDRLHKIRHFGLYSSPDKLEQARSLLGAPARRCPARSWQERLRSLTGHDVTDCPSCHATLTVVPLPAIRAPPDAHHD